MLRQQAEEDEARRLRNEAKRAEYEKKKIEEAAAKLKAEEAKLDALLSKLASLRDESYLIASRFLVPTASLSLSEKQQLVEEAKKLYAGPLGLKTLPTGSALDPSISSWMNVSASLGAGLGAPLEEKALVSHAGKDFHYLAIHPRSLWFSASE
jgi:hypothetical protein